MEESLSLYKTSNQKPEKIIPLSEVSEELVIDKHRLSLQESLEKIFGPELEEPLSLKLPLFKWKLAPRSGALLLYLLAKDRKAEELSSSLKEKISTLLLPGEKQRVLSSRNFSFSSGEGEESMFYFEEILIQLQKSGSFPYIEKNLPLVAHELKLGIESKSLVKPWTPLLNLDPDPYITQTLLRLTRRYPTIFDESIFRDLSHFLLDCREEFCKIRSMRHLARIVSTHYFFTKTLEQETKVYPGRRHLYFKLFNTELRYTFGLKRALGIAIAINSLQEYECFEPRHILKAINRVLPGVRVIPDSFYSNRSQDTKLMVSYLEIEKAKGEDFTREEIAELKANLKEELKNSIEYLTPALFLPRNEEELLRNIILLSAELKYVSDLPQAIISFQEQRSDVLKFNIILLRILTKKSKPIQQSSLLSLHDRLIVEKVAQVGQVRKKYTKEATVFSIEIENGLFLRKNHSVDLLSARQYIVKSVEKLVGPFRDYNGGFLLKQKEQLEAIRSALGELGKRHELILENLFYSLAPPIMQTFIAPELAKPFFVLFLELINQEIPKGAGYLLSEKENSGFFALAIKAQTPEIKERALRALSEVPIAPLKLASAALEIEGNEYLCYLYLNPTEEEKEAFSSVIKKALSLWSKGQNELQVLHLHLPRAPQSLDPRIGADRTSGVVIKMLYEGLVRVSRGGGPELAIAERVDISEDGKKYLFHLRSSYWSNGSPLTAYDFEYAWKKILEPHFTFSYSFLFHSIKNAKLVKSGHMPIDQVGITVQSDRELLVELEHPFPQFLDLLAHWTFVPLCREIDQKHPGWAYHSSETYVCNGPFKLSEWRLNDDLELVKNPHYWQAKSTKFDKISIHIIEDEEAAHSLFLKGKLDWHGDPVSKIPFKALADLQAKDAVHVSPISGLFWLQLNTRAIPFKNPKLRRAFATAISRKDLIDKILHSTDTPALGFYRKSSSPIFHDGDRELARKLFVEGLAELGMVPADLPPILFAHSEIEEHIAIARDITKCWEEVLGVKSILERHSWHNFFEALQRQDYMVGGLTWFSRYDDPSYYLEILSLDKPYISNWDKQGLVHLLEQAKHTLDPTLRQKRIEMVDHFAVEQMPVIPLFFQNLRYTKNPRLQNVILSENCLIDFREAFLSS